MKVTYLGHACFMITSDTGTRIIIDPYKTSKSFTYGEIEESADIVTVSHDHFDHSNVAAIRGNPEVVRGTAKVKGTDFKAIPSYHDDAEGKDRGNNTIFSFEVDGIKVCHLGDLGHRLSDKQVADLGKVDIVFVPVGGYYTIDARVASDVCNQIGPKVIIPMHFKTDKVPPVLSDVEEFIKGKPNVSRPDTSETDFRAEQLPTATQIIVLKSAL